jgi:hypothetical protein
VCYSFVGSRDLELQLAQMTGLDDPSFVNGTIRSIRIIYFYKRYTYRPEKQLEKLSAA